MNAKLKLGLIIGLLLSVLTGNAQTINGRLVDEQLQPIEFANIVLQKADSTFINGTISNHDGYFQLPISQEGKFIYISYVGYHAIYKTIEKEELGQLQLTPDTQLLGEVVVKGELPKTQLKGEAMVTTIAGSILEKSGTMEQLLDRIPNITAQNGEINVFGRGTPVIYINGRLMRDNIELERLNPENIKNIEVITNPGARYDASVTCVIRITTKKAVGEGFGFNNRIFLSLANEEHWSGQERFNFNYRKGGFDLNGMLIAAQWNTPDNKNLVQNTYLEQTWKQQNRIEQTYKQINYGSKLAASYQFNEKHSIGASLAYYENPSEAKGILYSTVEKDGALAEKSNNDYDSPDNKNQSAQGNLYYVGRVGKLDIDFNTDWSWNKDCDLMTTYEAFQETGKEEVKQDISTQTNTQSNLIASKLVLSYPVAGGNLTWGGEYSHSNRKTRYTVLPKGFIEDDNSRIKEGMATSFVEYTRSFGQLNIQAGLRYEHVNFNYYENGKRIDEQSKKFNNLFPSLALSMPVGKVQMSLGYATDIYRPSYWDLRSSVTYGNRYTYESGNPFLRPQISRNINYVAIYKWASFNMVFAHVNNPIINYSQTYNDNPAIALLQTINGTSYDKLSASLNLRPTIGIWHPALMIGIYKQWFQMEQIYLNEPIGTFRLDNTLETKAGNFTASVSYQTKGASENARVTRTVIRTSFSYFKSLFKNRLNVNLYIHNPLKTKQNVGIIYSGPLRTLMMDADAQRNINLTLTYKFNVSRSKYKGTGAGESQKNRM